MTSNDTVMEHLLERAAMLHYQSATEIELTQGEFIAAFQARELTGNKISEDKPADWWLFGLKVVKTQKRSN